MFTGESLPAGSSCSLHAPHSPLVLQKLWLHISCTCLFPSALSPRVFTNGIARRTPYRDDPVPESASPDASLNHTLDLPSPNPAPSNAAGVNGHANSDAAATNGALEVDPGASVENLTLSQASDPSSAAKTEKNTTSDLLPSINSTANDSVFEDLGTSTVPPIIEAPESDVRDDHAVPERDPLDLSAETAAPADPASVPPEASTESQEPDLTLDSNTAPPPAAAAAATTEAAVDPSEPQPDGSADLKMEAKDTEMEDAPVAPASSKIAREREDDGEPEPSAKRTKTEDLGSAPPPDLPTNGTSVQDSESMAATDAQPIQPHHIKEISRVIRNVLKTTSGKNFRAPVAVLWPSFADAYLEKISNPIDLVTIDKRLKNGEYATMKDFRAAVLLLYNNTLTFNGPEHVITKTAEEVRDAILSKTADLPPEPPAAAPKAAKKQPKRSTPAAEPAAGPTPPRRPSRSAGSGPAPTPNASKPETFALDPSTSTPLIRRDSTKLEGGRPKREIHPPKNKDLNYSVRPKSKKFATELRFCEEVLNELKKPKYSMFSAPFMSPVDPVALNVPNYFKVIKTPMDISTVSENLQSGHYTKAKDFETDVRLIFANCYKFNPPGNPVREMGKAFEELFDAQWAKKDKWIADHAPAAPSPSSAVETDEEESEEEEEPEPAVPPAATPAALRLIEEQNKLITLMTAKKPDQALIQMQQDLVEIVRKRVMEENQAAPKKTKKAKPAASKAPKKSGPAKKGAAGNAKKAGGQRQKYLGTLEKEVISNGLGSLPDDVSDVVLGLIKGDQPNVDVSLYLSHAPGVSF